MTLNLGLRWDGEQVRNYQGQTVLNFENQWQPRIGLRLGPVAGRHDEDLRLRGSILLRASRPSRILIPNFTTSHFFTFNFDPVSITQGGDVPDHPMLGGQGFGGNESGPKPAQLVPGRDHRGDRAPRARPVTDRRIQGNLPHARATFSRIAATSITTAPREQFHPVRA